MQSKISAKLLNSYSENIKTNLDRFLEQPFNTTLAIADNIQRNQLYQASDLTKIEDYLHSAISDIYYQQKQISTISFGSENKDYVGFRKNEDQDVSLILQDKRTNYELEFYHGESSDDIIDYSISNYDPTIRPWYAPFAREKTAGWAKIYSNVDEKNTFTISSISPVINDDTLVGIVATDINLRHLSHFIEPENRHFKGITYITDNQNKLIASSLKASLTDNDNNRIQAKESNNDLIAASGLYIANRQLQNKHVPATFEFDQNGIRYFSRITAYSNNNLQWFIIVTLPENVLLDRLPSQQRLGLIAALTLAFFGLLMGLYLLRIITQPIMDIAEISQQLDHNNWDVTIKEDIKLHETTQLISAFKSMSSRLERSFTTLRKQLLFDSLTGLLSRDGFVEKLNNPISQQQGILVLLGLRSFRHTNNSLGQNKSDLLLITIASRLQQNVADSVTISRIDKDTFAVFTPNFQDLEHSHAFAENLLTDFNRPFTINDTEVLVGANAGIMSGKFHDIDMDEWLRNSSLALTYAVKQEQIQRCHYQDYMMTASQEQTRLTTDLQRAITNNEFAVYYQPVIDLSNDTIAGAEALVRWHSPIRGIVSPLDFIPVAEDTGMIVDIGKQILFQACSDTKLQIDSGHWPASFALHVNMSVRELLHPDYVSTVKEILAVTQLPAANLTLEITESRLVSQPLLTNQLLGQLRSLGIQIAIDDFGTGYSSLAYLTQLQFDALKIDRSFVSQMLNSESHAAIVAAITTMTSKFNAEIVAEGVETAEQAQHLKQLGCRYAQGFYYSRPKPLAEWDTENTSTDS
ncbi:Sensory box/GGDEF family protein [Moritella viscosa]|uniref:Sensory box/GGDEF family protein n=2 Tax=Moritella viscosa TaxID=80854 RepID=A0ABY1HNI5_9GAMM|nr:EAL domain-containing protein [Moritella viscosa]SGY86432.1 Sensory box/GGDEF family protein [Moritella viscosa]SGZ03748.1 Sensory box/GGDEF family protein [Moritella viscosa]SGZ17934.1 Sensory box/GGDEF family protein [Moritella viscosa]SHO00400.1 Sensory box/GGDEF family protein [Moritella viscosa]SHO20275.1 Sensory box/GGDEF family protein [Moritella viscosa]